MENDHCAICLEDTAKCDVRTLSCNHIFHTKCFAEWSQKSISEGNTTCPCCRQSFLDPFECYRSVEMLPGATEIVYIPVEVERERKNYSNCACVFGVIAVVQTAFIYLQLGSCR